MRLLWKSILFHVETQWSSQSNFWSGIIGMIVNNALALTGIWAMLFAGRSEWNETRDLFLMMNFTLMIGWGIVHVFLGGITNLDSQINRGSLDLALTAPRHPFFLLSLTRSYLPAWGDILMGGLGIGYFLLQKGILSFLVGFSLCAFATIAMYSFFLLIGCQAFWFRRTDAGRSVLLNICLALNSYPIFDERGPRWVIMLTALFLVGVIPAQYFSHSSWQLLTIEIVGSICFFVVASLVFNLGLRRYQSVSVIDYQRM